MRAAAHISNYAIENDFTKELKINIPDFQKYFLVGYATTTHSAQGTMGEVFVKALMTIKKIRLDIKFIISGDC